jgi:hypothetical protein
VDPVNNLAQWDLIAGFFVPVVSAIILRTTWSDAVKAVANFVISAIVALGVVYFQGNLDVDNLDAIVSSVLIVLVTSIATYKGLWQKTSFVPALHRSTG